jgi:hypothetical protein
MDEAGHGPNAAKNISTQDAASMALRRTGFIAQEVEQAANSTGFNFDAIKKPANEKDYYSLSYSQFVVPLVKAVQEQEEIIKKQDQKLSQLEQRITELEKLLHK